MILLPASMLQQSAEQHFWFYEAALNRVYMRICWEQSLGFPVNSILKIMVLLGSSIYGNSV